MTNDTHVTFRARRASITMEVDPRVGRTVAARVGEGVSYRRRGERKVRAPQDTVVGNAHRPRQPPLAAEDRESATERIPPCQKSVVRSQWPVTAAEWWGRRDSFHVSPFVSPARKP